VPSHTHKKLFRCGGGLSSTTIIQTINGLNNHLNFFHNSGHDYFVMDEVERLTIDAQRSLRSPMGLERCMFFFTTNYLSKVDQGIVNRCHLVEMNQATTPKAYVPLGQSIVANMGLKPSALPAKLLQQLAVNARGSMRDYMNDVVIEAIRCGGVVPLQPES
jgi:DNA polymerase III delta prime subunit